MSEIRVSEIRRSKIRGSEIRVSEIRVSEIRISSNHRELHGAIFFPNCLQANKAMALASPICNVCCDFVVETGNSEINLGADLNRRPEQTTGTFGAAGAFGSPLNCSMSETKRLGQ